MVAQLPSIVGFGFCAGPEPGEAVPQRFLYRAIPPSLSDLAPEAILGALNEPEALAPIADALTQAGRERYESLPLFGSLSAGPEGLEWTSYWQDEPVVTLAGPNLEQVLESALRTSPVHHWSELHLEGFRESLEGLGHPDTPTLALEEGEHGLPVIGEVEGLSVPYGPLKVLLLAPKSEMVESLRADTAEGWELVLGSLGVLRRGSEHVEYNPWTLLRMQIPLTLVPQTLEWAASEEFRRPEAWAAPAVMPCGEWDVPRLIVGTEGPHAALVILPCQPEAMDPELLASLEAAMRSESTP